MKKEEAIRILESIAYWTSEINAVCETEISDLKLNTPNYTFDGYRVLDRYIGLQMHIDMLKKNPIKTFNTESDGEN